VPDLPDSFTVAKVGNFRGSEKSGLDPESAVKPQTVLFLDASATCKVQNSSNQFVTINSGPKGKAPARPELSFWNQDFSETGSNAPNRIKTLASLPTLTYLE